MPSVFPRTSVPRNRFFSHRPSFMARSAAGTDRASASISAHACSATLMLLAPGAFTTRIPRAAGPAGATRGGPPDEHRLGVGEAGSEVGRTAPAARVHHPAGFGAEHFQ